MLKEKELLKIFNELIKKPEKEWFEFKQAENDFDKDELGKYFSALSNGANLKQKQDAWFILGVSDKIPRKIIGTNYRKDRISLDKLKQEILQNTNSITFKEIYELHVDGKRIIMFNIPSGSRGIPTSWKGHYYGRAGESLVPLGEQEYNEIRAQVVYDWTAEICEDASLDDLDINALNKAKANYYEKNLKFKEENWDDMTFLNKARLAKNNKITRATILLLGKPESSHFLNHISQIVWKLDYENEQANEIFYPPFLLNVEEIFKKIRNVSFRIQPFNHLIPVEIKKYDSEIILEALNNCIAHQDYTANSRIIVIEKLDKLILQNCGTFFESKKLEDYLYNNRVPEKYRNPFLVEAMRNINMIDSVGNGIKRMFRGQINRHMPLPSYQFDDKNVNLIIYGKIINENYTRILMEEKELDLREIVLLDKIQKQEKVKLEDIKNLRKKRLIEGRFPKIHISAKVAEILDKKIEYVKNKGFDDKHYEKLILEYIAKFKKATRQDIDALIKNKLPDILSDKQKESKIHNLVSKMKRNKLIYNDNDGKKKWTVWKKYK